MCCLSRYLRCHHHSPVVLLLVLQLLLPEHIAVQAIRHRQQQRRHNDLYYRFNERGALTVSRWTSSEEFGQQLLAHEMGAPRHRQKPTRARQGNRRRPTFNRRKFTPWNGRESGWEDAHEVMTNIESYRADPAATWRAFYSAPSYYGPPDNFYSHVFARPAEDSTRKSDGGSSRSSSLFAPIELPLRIGGVEYDRWRVPAVLSSSEYGVPSDWDMGGGGGEQLWTGWNQPYPYNKKT